MEVSLGQLPLEILEIIRKQTSSQQVLANLSNYLLNKSHTDQFPLLDPLIPELALRWLDSGENLPQVIGALGRIVPFHSYLLLHATTFLRRWKDSISSSSSHWGEAHWLEYLLGVFRIISAHPEVRLQFTPPNLEIPLGHGSSAVRCLSLRILLLYTQAADAATEEILSSRLGCGAIREQWEGKRIDYQFLPLWERKRNKDILRAQQEAAKARGLQSDSSLANGGASVLFQNHDLLKSIAIDEKLIPRPLTSSTVPYSTNYVPTTSATQAMRSLIEGLLSDKPVMLVGSPGSGKSTIINNLAGALGQADRMVTLHLNEQSDVKSLLGVYASSPSAPGTFTWSPGVLLTAVQEGRWVLIENVDRAPNEIVGALLPLLENNELVIPGRTDRVRAALGFKLFSTMSTKSSRHLIGTRFWRKVEVAMPSDHELKTIISARFPSLHSDTFMSTFSTIRGRLGLASLPSTRSITSGDLFKWCRRVERLSPLADSGLNYDTIFLEGVDCLVAHVSSGPAQDEVIETIARTLHIDPNRRDHLLHARSINLALHGLNPKALSKTFSTNQHTVQLLRRILSAVKNCEPLLLVGETGTGKTTAIQQLAKSAGKKLTVVNLSQQLESSDLLGGMKPIDLRRLAMTIQEEFEQLFLISFSRKDNGQFLELLSKSIAKGQWKRACKLWKGAIQEAKKEINSNGSKPSKMPNSQKRQKLEEHQNTNGNLVASQTHHRWMKLSQDVDYLNTAISSSSDSLMVSFQEGKIVHAVRNGGWVLLDEINLAPPDTIEALSGLFNGGDDESRPSLLLSESGSAERVNAHPEFRIFAAMNPATDIGKRDLIPSIRSRFTEIFVDSPDKDINSLQHIIRTYLGDELADKNLVSNVANLYLKIQALSREQSLVDGAGTNPHFTLRSLTRSLLFARDIAHLCGIRRGLYEGIHMSFMTSLDRESEKTLTPVVVEHVFGKNANIKAELSKSLRKPVDGRTYVQYRQYWLRQGNYPAIDQSHYIITPFIRRNLDNLIRATFSTRYPILIQGPTSSGKTSMVEYLANLSGNKCVRVNNHEYTDLQEYLGTYVAGDNGQIRFHEGILVEALRNGYWLILDELNLAPSDVLEALNRLLDDNRELLIPETQEIVRPHENFMLFATQNPAGFLYGGRKPLSRALRNRFLELHFDDIPVEELCEILQRRTQIPESWCRRIVEVYQELSQVRQENRIFEQHSFATLRDLFRWALRRADSVNELATNGYMLLAERVRKDEERAAVKDIIERVMSRRGPSVRIDPDVLYARTAPQIAASSAMSQGIVWTKSMRRLFMLVSRALQNNEPVLLVGETGCGKTTVCQVLANVAGRQLYTVNAHRNTETADLIGSQRPVRNRSEVEKQLREKLLRALDISEGASPSTKMLLERFQGSSNEMPSGEIKSLRAKYLALFQWDDGPLVAAMRAGQYFLIDEISLAEDSVLERINSVLEPDRGIFLAEMGSNDAHISAAGGFQLMATMNPGGDYGKRELSPALRNRFTEIWVPPLADLSDIFEITRATLQQPGLSDPLIGFAKWFSENYNTSSMSALSVRDILTCVGFINRFSSLEAPISLLHAISMVYVDTLGANPAALLSLSSSSSLPEERAKCIQKLDTLIGIEHLQTEYQSTPDLILSDHIARIGRFELPRDSFGSDDDTFTFEAETTRRNAMRIIRALQLSKPILIEGEPGVGKTALVTSISRVVGKKLVRINLSEQTDLMDLFGSDVPVEGEAAGRFAWRDAPFLAAMKVGDWVLLDEMNLAPQSILEGLNACFDHRGEAYIAELNQTFHRHPDFRVFAAQNPHHQGGGRKGLPASFVNRFTVVYADPFTPNDISVICQRLFPDVDHSVIESIAQVIARVASEDKRFNKFGSSGAPWEVNLRDALRWLLLLSSGDDFISNANGHDLFDIVFRRRFRTEEDMLRMDNIYAAAFKSEPAERSFYHDLAPTLAQVGIALMPRTVITNHSQHPMIGLPSSHLPILEAMMVAVQQAWPVILAGPAGSGKTNLLHHLSARKGTKLVVLPMNSDIDATDLIGSFEQADASRRHITAVGQLRHALQVIGIEALKSGNVGATVSSFELLADISESSLPSILAKVKLQLQSYKLENPDSTDRLIAQCEELTKPALENSGPMFQWVDGPLVQAVERGDWLVLDNANLCSSSVLDRLNSLLEPNGTLVINENSLPNGETRIVQPHDNFRIFLTLDPIHGELSSAMRNRALELCVSMPDASTTILDLPMQSTEYNLTKVIEIANIATTCEDYDPEQWADAMIDHTGLDRIIEFAHRNPDTLCDELRIGLLDGQLSPKIVHTLEGRLKQISRPSEASTIGTFIERFCIALGEMRFRRPWFPLVSLNPLNNNALMRAAFSGWPQGACVSRLLDVSMTFERLLDHGKELPTEHSGLISSDFKPSLISSFRGLVLRLLHGQNGVTTVTLDFVEELTIFWKFLFSYFENTSSGSAYHLGLDVLLSRLSQLSLDEKQDELIGDIVQEHSLLLRDMLQTGGNRTGIYLEPMWDHFKPPLLQQASLLPSILQLRDLADRFDHQSSKGMVNVSLVVKLRKSFRQSLQLMQDAQSQLTQDGHSPNPQGLIDELNDQLENIEKSTSMAQSPRRVFSAELNEISQGSYMLRVAGRPIPESTADLLDVVSAGSMPTRYFLSPAQFDSATGAARLLHDLSLYASCGAEEDETGDTQPPSTIQSLKLSKTVAFTDLEFFVEELTLFGEVLARCATFYLQEKEPIFDEALATLSTEMRRSLKSEIPGSSEHLKVAKTLLDETNDYLTNGANTAAQAWTALGVAAVLLYVPDHIIDPVEKQRLQLEAQGFIANQYKTRVAVLEEFELHAMFSRNPFRKQILAGQLAKEQQKSKPLTLLPERPTADILPELQAEFNRVIRVVGTICSRMMLNENIDDQTLAPSLLRIIRRLRKKYASHEDLAHPLIGFLSIILVGCMIRRNKRIETDATRGSWLSALFAPSFSDEKLQHYFPGSPINQLEVQVLNRALRMGLQDRSKSGTEDIFEMLYLKWKDEISKAQIENAKNASLYTFQDEQEIEDDIDEQLKLLFPGLELAEVESKAKPDELRDLSIRLSTIHRDLNSSLELNEVFMATMESTTAFDCNWNSTQILPLLYTKIHDRLLQLQASSVDASYNIYHDSNLQEAKKMADLASGSAKRFHSLHLRWPEHDSINEVLRICAEILGQGHAEPLMKYLPRCESLHFALDQWQKVASKEFRVDDLVERLTSLIADWRRLELSTWSRLLDFEISKCSDNAKSWWFILYENFMHVPDGQFNGAAQEHARVLGTLRTVEQFLSTSNIGEFVSRLDLLRVFALDVESRLEDHPWFRALAPGLSNIFSYFARFLGSVEKSLAQTRQKLEKEVKNVLLLASWKDTNIDSLKQSAKASHRKLFKVVRTFRQALHQPVALSLDQFPEKAIVGYKAQTDLTSSHEESSSLRSSDIIESWTWLPARFRNVNSTVEMIQLIYSRSNQYVRSSPRLESFLESLLQSISDLQRQTPKLLKEDNKDLVKHLKSQKRVLFATTLKGLREMGLSTNPTTTTLRQQDDICSVMAQIPAVSPDICNERWRTSEYFFHKVLTMLPTVRLLSREHSGDLSSSEVARCLGFFESLLNQTIQQRTRLATVLNEFVSLKRIFELVHILSSTNAIHHDRTATCSGLRENYLTSRRLSVSCLGIRNAISAQAELGKLDTKSVSQGLDAWSRTFSDYAANILALGNYPTNIASSAQIDVYQRGQSLYAEFESALATWSRQSPEASPVLDHLTDLLQKCNPGLNAESTLNSANPLAVDDFGQMVFSFLDLLLGAIQDLEAANSKLPDSQETPRWLVAESKAQIAAASTLRLPFLEERLKSAVDDLQHLQDEQLGIAVAALATFRPILTQFQDVGRQVIDELASLHASTVKVLYHLSASFLSVGKDGFCTPPEEQASGSDGEKLEGGDVFGDGEGAENVSGEMNEDDIASDTEAEPKQKDASGDESDNDALDADDSDMEGKAEDVSDTEDKSGDESEPELDEDVGDVNEGPSKIDEKRWDDGASSEKKEMETAETNNAQESEDQVATEGQDKANGKQDDANSPDHASPEDEDEEVTQNELDDGDQMQDSNNLDLPDDINLDSLSQPDMDSDVDDISDDGDASDMDIDDANENKPTDDQDDVSMTDEVDENAMDMDEASEPAEEGDNPVPQPDDAPNSGTNAGADADPNAPTDGDSSDKRLPQNNSAEDSAHREENAPDAGVMDADEEIGTNEEREDNQGDRSDGVGRTETTQHPTVESIKKLGDIMENWVRQSRPIQASQTEAATASIEDVADPDKVDFEHMQDDSKEDAQAMDVASKEEATALDQHMDSLASETHEREEYKAKDAESQELKNPLRPFNSAQDQTENNNSFIGSNAQSDRLEELGIVQAPESPEEHHVAEDLSNIHLDAQNQLAEEADFAEASTQWARHEQATRALASVLAEQLRLVLAPTHAAKLRGDFKTGKRINMRRIIPYIASSYKRDKIWMRRSVPSKRRYQIMIALDDSRSMRDDAASPTEAPTGAKVDLALQTLALVAKALSILEAGSTCFLGFGERVTVAHPFGAPFGPAAGPRLLSTFRFAQDGTDVPRLLRTATRMLADARRTGEGAGGAGEDVWQLLIVVGDGICEDHEAVRRMVRRAREERVMCVFVVVDCKGGSGGAGGGGGAPGIMELQTARFAADEASGEMRLVRARYMDTFPFEWWVVVRDVRELPGVLASALKQWFREIAHVPV